MPKAQYRSDDDLYGTQAAYSDGAIYLNEDLKNDPAKADRAYLHEVGHALDDKFGKGDEGLLFEKMVYGDIKTDDTTAINTIRNIDDHGKMKDKNGVEVDVENKFGDRIKKAVKKVVTAPFDFVKGAAKAAEGMRNMLLEFLKESLNKVIPAKAGIHKWLKYIDSRLRGSDDS